MVPQPQMEHVKNLEASRDEFIAAASGLTDAQAKQQPEPGRWSLLDCAEHIVITEGRFLNWLETAETEGAPARDPEKEAQLAARVSSRTSRAQAPDPAKPVGRFATLADALAEFQAARARTIQFAVATGDGLYSLATKHPFFGSLNGAELVVLIAGHSRRHAAQAREVRAQLGCE